MNWQHSMALGAIAVGLITTPAMAESTPKLANESQAPTANIRLNDSQSEVIREVSGLMLDQLEAIVEAGLDPTKVDRTELAIKARRIGTTLSTIRPDQQQLGALRTLLQNARQQIETQLETELPPER